MKKKVFLLSFIIVSVFLISAPSCWAKTKGYLYVMGYSNVQKKAFFSSVIIQKVRDISYSHDEYVTEVELIQKMEAQFQKYLSSTEQINPEDYTISVKGAYKSKSIAEKTIQQEKERYMNRGYNITVLDGFVYDD